MGLISTLTTAAVALTFGAALAHETLVGGAVRPRRLHRISQSVSGLVLLALLIPVGRRFGPIGWAAAAAALSAYGPFLKSEARIFGPTMPCHCVNASTTLARAIARNYVLIAGICGVLLIEFGATRAPVEVIAQITALLLGGTLVGALATSVVGPTRRLAVSEPASDVIRTLHGPSISALVLDSRCLTCVTLARSLARRAPDASWDLIVTDKHMKQSIGGPRLRTSDQRLLDALPMPCVLELRIPDLAILSVHPMGPELYPTNDQLSKIDARDDSK